MQKILVLSGKGGTGKTSVISALIRLAEAQAYADCDVDAPNLHLLQKPTDTGQQRDFLGLDKALIATSQCISCDLCRQHCRFGAIRVQGSSYTVDPFFCEGCAVCTLVCPVGAITMEASKAGRIKMYREPALFSMARLEMGSGNSGLLVTEVKKALEDAVKDVTAPIPLAFIDGSPGIGCPVIASISGVDLVLVVAEASAAGFSDMERLVETTVGLQVPLSISVNQGDTSREHTARIEGFCADHKLPYLGTIPYDPKVVELLNQGRTMVDEPCPAGTAVRCIWSGLQDLLQQT